MGVLPPRTEAREHADHTDDSTASNNLTRRRMLAATGATVTGLAVAGTASAATSARSAAGLAPGGQIGVELLAAFDLEADRLTAVGYLEDVYGVPASALLSRQGGPSRLVFDLTAKVTRDRTAAGVRVVASSGDLRIFVADRPPESLDDRGKFRGNQVVAATARLQTVSAIGEGVATITGDVVISSTRRFGLGVGSYTLGEAGAAMQLTATGPMRAVRPDFSHVQHTVAGSLRVAAPKA